MPLPRVPFHASVDRALVSQDAGFDWKVLGPDVADVDYVAWQSDQDAYACSGQKCSAQSIVFAHENWVRAGLLTKMEQLASRRRLEDLTIGPVLTWTTEAMLGHVSKLSAIPGARVLFGGKPLSIQVKHSIPEVYGEGGGGMPVRTRALQASKGEGRSRVMQECGPRTNQQAPSSCLAAGAILPTAVFVPLEQILRPENFGLVTTEVFGPVQVVTEWKEGQLPLVLQALERQAAPRNGSIVGRRHSDPFLAVQVGQAPHGGHREQRPPVREPGARQLGQRHHLRGHPGKDHRQARAAPRLRPGPKLDAPPCSLPCVRAGAPQNHWFGPSGDPRGAGIGTPEAIRLVWSSHREIISDFGPCPPASKLATS